MSQMSRKSTNESKTPCQMARKKVLPNGNSAIGTLIVVMPSSHDFYFRRKEFQVFIENRMLVRITDKDGKTFTGTLYETTIQPDLENGNKPEAVLFLDQDERFIDSEDEFGMLAILVSEIKSIEILDNEATVKKIKKENERIREKHKRKAVKNNLP